MIPLLFVALAFGADDDVEPPRPSSKSPPTIVSASVTGDQLTHTRQTLIYETRTENITIKENGQVRVVTRTVAVPVYRESRVAWDLKKATATAGGKKVDLDEVKKRLAKPALVVVSGDGKAVDAAFLKLLAKDTLVIVAPQVGPDAKQMPKP